MNSNESNKTAFFHLPGLFEFCEFYEIFLPLFYEHREYFYDWCEIGSIYGAPADCLWGGGRVGFGEDDADELLEMMKKYGISARLTFSNSLIREEHLSDKKCNELCDKLSGISCEKSDSESCYKLDEKNIKNGVIIHSDILLNYLKNKYPDFYFVSSTTKVITDFDEFVCELNRDEFKYVVPDFRLNKNRKRLEKLEQNQKDRIEFLCNECCSISCKDRKACYENVSRKALGEKCDDHICKSSDANEGYRFSLAMKNPAFISREDISGYYLPMGFSQFKIEGRSLGSAILLEFILYYMTKPEYHILVREAIYLDSMLDLF